jgi:hypothetical protein
MKVGLCTLHAVCMSVYPALSTSECLNHAIHTVNNIGALFSVLHGPCRDYIRYSVVGRIAKV